MGGATLISATAPFGAKASLVSLQITSLTKKTEMLGLQPEGNRESGGGVMFVCQRKRMLKEHVMAIFIK